MGWIDEVESYERQLRRAMLHSDVAELTRLLSDTLVFTDQDGARLTKDDDLSAHGSGLLNIETLRFLGEPIVRLLGETAIVSVTAELAGEYAEQAFGGTFAYSRVWRRTGEGWQVELGHCSRLAGTPGRPLAKT